MHTLTHAHLHTNKYISKSILKNIPSSCPLRCECLAYQSWKRHKSLCLSSRERARLFSLRKGGPWNYGSYSKDSQLEKGSRPGLCGPRDRTEVRHKTSVKTLARRYRHWAQWKKCILATQKWTASSAKEYLKIQAQGVWSLLSRIVRCTSQAWGRAIP